jgi:acyl dehydratase
MSTASIAPVFSDLAVGQDLGSRSIAVTRQDLVKYAGASGDFNPIHWNEAFASGVGLPGVIAHGMFTMGAAVQLVTDWAGDPAAVVDFQTRFTKPVLVADTTGTDEPGPSSRSVAPLARLTRMPAPPAWTSPSSPQDRRS